MEDKRLATQRLDSLDALRGFDMFWIMGAPGIIFSLEKLFGGSILAWLSLQMNHAEWDGLRIMDLVFPTFLFIAGCSFPFSLSNRRKKGEANSSIYKHIFIRTFWMVFLGCIYNGLLQFDFEHMRYASVLARIGLAWMFGALIFMHTPNPKVRLAIPFVILAAYSLIIGNVLAPDAPAGTDIYSPQGSLVGWIDRMFLPGRLHGVIFDPEGILGIIPAIATALFGMLAGDLLQNREKYTPNKTTLTLVIGGVALIISGLILNIQEPIIKALWSSSFTLVAGGISMLVLALFYWIIDVKGIKKWSFFFKIIGSNSLVIYLGQAIIPFYLINQFIFGGFPTLLGENLGGLIVNCGYVAVCWGFLYFLYKKKVFLKI